MSVPPQVRHFLELESPPAWPEAWTLQRRRYLCGASSKARLAALMTGMISATACPGSILPGEGVAHMESIGAGAWSGAFPLIECGTNLLPISERGRSFSAAFALLGLAFALDLGAVLTLPFSLALAFD